MEVKAERSRREKLQQVERNNHNTIAALENNVQRTVQQARTNAPRRWRRRGLLIHMLQEVTILNTCHRLLWATIKVMGRITLFPKKDRFSYTAPKNFLDELQESGDDEDPFKDRRGGSLNGGRA